MDLTITQKCETIFERERNGNFKGVELTGSNIGTEKDPNISLLDVTKNTIIPAIEEKVVTRYNVEGRIKVCVLIKRMNQDCIRIRLTNAKKIRSSKIEIE